ncbi:MAG TPA: hypothetical protein VGE67_14685 [Haloferula sp.]
MKILRILAIVGFSIALIYGSWLDGYRKGSRDTAEREAKAWEFLIASGRLDGLQSGMHRWPDKMSADNVDRLASDYRSDYGHFIAAGAKVTEQSRAHWLVGNHTRGKMKPEEFESILREYQSEVRPPGEVDETKSRVAE